MSTEPRTSSISIGRLRALILIALVAGLSIFTGVMFQLVHGLSERFGPQVEADLEWRALRGAQELAKTADLGLAVSDENMVTESFGVYAKSRDVVGIIAADATNKVIARHGTFQGEAVLFAQKPSSLIPGPSYLASWAPAVIEGNTVGKVAIVVSTGRMSDATASLDTVKNTTLIAGAVALALGVLFVLFFTHAVSVRDHQLGDYAANLEKKVDDRTRELDERTRGMRLVLDNVAQGFITIDPHGVMASERSAIVRTWFGDPAPGSTFGAMIAEHAPGFGTWLGLGLEDIRANIMPIEVTLDQLPKRFVAGSRTFDVGYSPILEGDEVARILLIVSDVTAEIERERTQREQRETVELFQRITADRLGFDEFLVESGALVDSLREPVDVDVEKRVIHTLKGNCGIYGIHSYAELCHEIENQVNDAGELTDDMRARLGAGWRAVVDRLDTLTGGRKDATIHVDQTDLRQLIARAHDGASGRDLATTLASWLLEPISIRLGRLGRQATSLARRLGKGDIAVEIHDDDHIRTSPEQLRELWGAMVHAVRNAIDHGIEAPDVRAGSGKPAMAKLALTASREAGHLVITLSDDGGGIDWDAVRAKATTLGLPVTTRDDLTEALFSDGVSTRSEATEISGRGVGLSALRTAVVAAGGTIRIDSERGKGTSFIFSFPESEQVTRLRPPTMPIRKVG